jgi:hypothetical protein
MIRVEEQDPNTFEVIVENGGASTHRVTVPDDYHRKLVGDAMPKKELVKKSFEFLLERESKESILGSFELSVIQRYFPEYEREIGSR